MINFTKVDKNAIELKKYFDISPIKVCDISVGVKYLWRKEYQNSFTILNDTLILKEEQNDNKNNFYYPIGKDIDNALSIIEKFCIENNIDLKFCWVTNEYKQKLLKRFYNGVVYTPREWQDYIYNADEFKTFVGKKYSGQRNHINKFKKLYPNYSLKQIDKSNLPLIKELLNNFEEKNDLSSHTAQVEDLYLRDFLDNMFMLNQFGLMIMIDEKCVAFSVGEIVDDTLIVHVEKALTTYEGIYPFIANEFVKTFANEKIKYINREEDCGDEGLRTSKLQYHPIEIREKSFIVFSTLFSKIVSPINLKTKRLTITDIYESDSEQYFKLYTDDEENKYWGYNYKEDLNGKSITPSYFYNFQKKLKDKKEEYSLAIKLENKMIGELVMHNFDFSGCIEIGFRTLKEYQKSGYTYEATLSLIQYIFDTLNAKKIKAKCYKDNYKSKNFLEKLEFSCVLEDNIYYYFELQR